jgi:peroxiredoxin
MNQEKSKGAAQPTGLPKGADAPDFTLHNTPDQGLSLRDFRGQPVILMFYPADWSPVCGDEIAIFNELLPEFRRHNAALLGVSVDGPWCHIAYARERKIRFPLLSDFEPKGEVARKYGVYHLPAGVAERALFVIDEDGKVFWGHVSPMGINPGADGVLQALDDLAAERSRRTREPEPAATSST